MGNRASLFLYLCVLALAACSAPPRVAVVTSPSPATLRIALGGVPASFDPALQREPWELALASFYTEPLLKVAPDLADVEPAAAASYDVSPDGRVYTFHLRPDGRFWDGTPVTAADFVFAWRRLIDPRTASPHADLFASAVAGGAYAEALDPEDPTAPIAAALGQLGLAAPDPSTFRVTLAQPSAWFKWVATVRAGAPLEPGNLRSNGPFRIQGLAAGVVTLVASSHYRVRPRLQRVLAYETGGAAAVEGFAAGAYDLAPVPPESAGQVQSEPGLADRLRRVPQLETEWIVINAYRSPFDRPAVRQALAEALDPTAYAGGQAQPAVQLIPLGMPGGLPGPAGLQRFDPAAARARLAGSGVQLKALHLLVERTAGGRALGSFVQSQLSQHLGIGVTVDAVSPATYATRIQNRQFDLAGPQRWVADYPDPQDWLDQFTTGNGTNAGRWQDPLYDDLVELGDSSLDAGARGRAYAQSELEMSTGAPAVWLDQPVAWVLVSPRLRGLVVSQADPVPALGTTSPESLYLEG